ncbi:MAG: excalibur calcium-binding domain-containing protein [Marmoricola sp.]
MLKKLLIATAATTMLVGGTAHSADAATHAKEFKNCTALNHTYVHGVGRSGAHDKTSGKPVTTFKHSTALYNANKKSDRDKDGIACEKR